MCCTLYIVHDWRTVNRSEVHDISTWNRSKIIAKSILYMYGVHRIVNNENSNIIVLFYSSSLSLWCAESFDLRMIVFVCVLGTLQALRSWNVTFYLQSYILIESLLCFIFSRKSRISPVHFDIWLNAIKNY